MTDDVSFRTVFATLINAPVVVFSMIYFARTLHAYLVRRDARRFQYLVLAVCAAAGALCVALTSYVIVLTDSDTAISVIKILLNAARVILLASLVTLVFVRRGSDV